MIILLLIKTAISLLAATVFGYFIVKSIIPENNRLLYGEYILLSYVSGLCAITIIMLFLSLLGIPFSLINIVISISISTAILLLLIFIKGKKVFVSPDLKWSVLGREKSGNGKKLSEYVIVLIIVFIVLLSFASALFYPMQGWDAMAHWGIKAKIFFVNESVTYLNFDIHNEYPNFMPLAETWIYECMGEINDRIVMILFPLFFLSLLIMFYILQRKYGFSKLHSLLFTLLLILSDNAILRHSYMAYSDMALTFVYSTGVLMLLLWMSRKELKEYFILGSLLTGMSLWIKLESITLVFVALLFFTVFVITEKKHWKHFFVFFICLSFFYIPWFLFCSVNNLAVSARYNIIIPDINMSLSVLSHFLFRSWESAVWTAFFVLSIFSAKRIIRGNNKLIQYLVATVYVNLMIIIFTYLVNPETYATMTDSMHRLMMHISPLALFFISHRFNEFYKELRKENVEGMS